MTVARKRVWGAEARLAYALVLPALLVLAALMLYPIGYVFQMSLFRTDKLGRLQEFAGLANFAEHLSDREFWRIAFRSLYWTVFGVAAKTLLGMAAAVLLNVDFPGRKVARLLFIIPWASAVPISALLWQWVYHAEFGLLNHTLRATGLWSNPPVWLGYPVPAFIATLWVDVWIGIPFMALVFLAGMQSIPGELYESAGIDGANAVQRFWFITLPGIRHIILIATMLSSLWTFNDFNSIYILTRGGPAGTTDILITAIYKSGFEWLKFSRAAVMAVVTFLILTGVSIVYARAYFRTERA